ncbi:MAG: prephenate dehydrogenase/arogenate dehydrogenase family protein [Leptospiraceae bacterium]|nr:prephenate dehydrogenase/arogenate dehydrogenase family protein [Leptospiraceae bacterium]
MIENLKHVCIYGMGLMGTSLAYSLKNHAKFKGKISGIVRSEKSQKWIKDYHLADEVYLSTDSLVKPNVMDSDLLIIGLPVLDTIDLIHQLVDWKYDGLVTDMCSTRYVLEEQIRSLEKIYPLRFIGAHPMCGSEVSGPEGFVKDLYENKLCIIIDRLKEEDLQDRNKNDLEKVIAFWKEIGMHIFLLDAQMHDYIVSYLSHAPHILSSILATIIGRKDVIIKKNLESTVPILGGGLKDMIRIAGSNPKMWYDIIETNKKNILSALKDYQEELNHIIDVLSNNNDIKAFWFDWQNQSKKYRDSIYGNPKE